MKFSIIIPVYNAEKYLSEAIESVLNQKATGIEIIIVDDGSTDGSEKIYNQYLKKYPSKIVVIKQKNSGQLAARCQGIANSKGEYCLFLDADDLLVEECLEELEKYIREYKNPDIIFFPFYYDRGGVLQKSRMFNERISLYEGEKLLDIYNEVCEGTLMNSMCTKAIRREIAMESTKNYEKYTHLRCAEDRYQSMMILKSVQKILYVTKAYYRYRIVEGSTTRQFCYHTIDRFNIAILHNVELECLRTWGIDCVEWREKLLKQWVEYPLYVLNLFYNNVSKSEKNKVLSYSWNEFLPANIKVYDIENSPRINKEKKKLWKWIREKKYQQLKLFFLKKRIFKCLRGIRHQIIKKYEER